MVARACYHNVMPRTIDLDARRVELAEATWRVIREKGIGAVSVRTIAAEAGLVVGSLRHVFPTRAELLEFSARLMIDRATARITAIEPTGDTLEDAVAVLQELLPLTADSRAELEVNLALIAETPALPRLAGIRDEADTAQVFALKKIEELVPRATILEKDDGRLRVLYEVLKRIGGAQDLNEVLVAICESSFKLVPLATHVTIVLRDDDEEQPAASTRGGSSATTPANRPGSVGWRRPSGSGSTTWRRRGRSPSPGASTRPASGPGATRPRRAPAASRRPWGS